jgi:predicted outer membrane protein
MSRRVNSNSGPQFDGAAVLAADTDARPGDEGGEDFDTAYMSRSEKVIGAHSRRLSARPWSYALEPTRRFVATHLSEPGAPAYVKRAFPPFDRQFARHMVMDHKEDIGEYQADSRKNDPTASYASDALPTLQKHLEMAQSLTKSLAGK